MKTANIWRLLPLIAGTAILLSRGPHSAAAEAEPAWMVGSFPGFEVYTNATEEHTRRLLEDILELQQDFAVVWPAPEASNLSPGRIIICNQPWQFLGLTQGTMDRGYYGATRAFSGNLSLAINAGFQVSVQDTASAMGNVIANPSLEITTHRKEFVLADYFAGNSMEGLYANHYMALLGERIPPWLFYGLHALIAQLDCTEDAIRFPPAASDTALKIRRREHGSEASLDAALRDRRFLTLEELFAATKEPPPIVELGSPFVDGQPRGPRARDFWPPYRTRGLFVDESYEFVQFCLFAGNGRYRIPFIKFAHAVSNGPLDEAAFHRLFGKSYRAMLLEFWGYGYTNRNRVYHLPHPLPPPSIVFRPATQAEIQEMIAVWTSQWNAQKTRQTRDFEYP